MKMKAAVLRRFDAGQPFADSKPISIEEVTLDPPGPNEVLVRIGGAGLCHSDLSVMNGARPRPEPLVLGHEGAGSIVEVGSAITDIAPGDHIAAGNPSGLCSHGLLLRMRRLRMTSQRLNIT